jgi:hypothetical protein
MLCTPLVTMHSDQTHLFSDAKASSDTHTSSQTRTFVLQRTRAFSSAERTAFPARDAEEPLAPRPSPGTRPPLGVDPVYPPWVSTPCSSCLHGSRLRGLALIFIRALPVLLHWSSWAELISTSRWFRPRCHH